jgi:tRNA pseudouridine55 synthase
VIRHEGIALVAKPEGLTSYQTLGPLKRSLGTRKLGHTGTLDKFASGLLVILVGALTRLGPWFTAMDKVYEATLRFGEETDSLDPEGEVIARADPPSLEALRLALPTFRGEIMQAPPAFSAIHIDGERASDRARRGEVLDMAARPVTIHELDLLNYDGRDAKIRVRCSSGTYIRSLARDIALSLGSRARLETLSRTRVGPFRLEAARAPEDFSGEIGLIPLDAGAATALGFEALALSTRALRAFSHGGFVGREDLQPMEAVGGEAGVIAIETGAPKPLAVFSEEGAFLGVMEDSDGLLRYRFVCPPETAGGVP